MRLRYAWLAVLSAGCEVGVGEITGLPSDTMHVEEPPPPPPPPAPQGLPCAAVEVLTVCDTCHGSPPSPGVPLVIVTREDLARPSQLDPTVDVAHRSVLRMRAAAAEMPPAPSSRVPGALIDAFEQWVNAGMPAGSCTVTTGDAGTPPSPPDAGSPPLDAGTPTQDAGTPTQDAGTPVHDAGTPMQDAGTPTHDAGTPVPDAGSPAPVTCASNNYWPAPTAATVSRDDFMDPGFACVSCHRGQNFMGQNQFGYTNPTMAYYFMGTVFPDLHEKDRCLGPAAANVTVEILDSNGNVALSLVTNGAGNFYSNSLTAGISLPYTARLKLNGRTRTMTTPQMDGDCNTCHTEQGLNGAPGRIQAP